MRVLIAGGGIAGLATALTCHQIDVPFKVFESVQNPKALGVGINVQPNAVRELFDLGLEEQLDKIGIRTRDYGMYSKKGLHIWTEPRGTWAGYNWPQFSVHRGELHMMLYHEVLKRAGPKSIETGWSVEGFATEGDEAILQLRNAEGEKRIERGSVAIGADGIHSAMREQMYPNEGEPKWGGAMLWRGTSMGKPFLTGASMVMVGYDGFRFVSYPITKPDPQTGLARLNWIANLNLNPNDSWNKEDYSREAKLEDFLPQFKKMKFDWLNVPSLIQNAEKVYEYPMVDRDPINTWTFGRVSLIGDAAHAAYPVGSNGAGSAILDARQLGAAFLEYGVTPKALHAYEEKSRPMNNKVILRNRSAGPDKILDIVEERSGGSFNTIETVITQEELAEHAKTYKAIAGYGIKSTNEAPRLIPNGARVS